MEMGLKSLINGENCILESPTGSGKTLALLSFSLAYLKKWRASFVAENIEKILKK